MKIFNWRLGSARQAAKGNVCANLLLSAVRAFREAEKVSRKAGCARREHTTIAEFAEPVVVPPPLQKQGG